MFIFTPNNDFHKTMEFKILMLSVVSPVYGCSTSLVELYLRLQKAVSSITENVEIIFVNDNSPDEAWGVIEKICEKDNRVKAINLSRNFGQHYAIAAGLEYSKGEWVVVMDCDLQDQPEEIPTLYFKAIEGWDIVFGRRQERKDNFLKSTFSRFFYSILGYLTDTKQDSTIANFGIYHRKVIDAICSMGDSMRYFPAMARWVGFKQTSVNIQHAERTYGKTSYSFGKLLRLGMDVILAFSDKPLRLTAKLGLAISFISILLVFVFLYGYLSGTIIVPGFTSLILSVWLLGGIIIFLIGMVGLYIGKTFENVKNRPKYIIKDRLNFENE
jgi:dolichol-phosphate mannosyltransferase